MNMTFSIQVVQMLIDHKANVDRKSVSFTILDPSFEKTIFSHS